MIGWMDQYIDGWTELCIYTQTQWMEGRMVDKEIDKEWMNLKNKLMDGLMNSWMNEQMAGKDHTKKRKLKFSVLFRPERKHSLLKEMYGCIYGWVD